MQLYQIYKNGGKFGDSHFQPLPNPYRKGLPNLIFVLVLKVLIHAVLPLKKYVPALLSRL